MFLSEDIYELDQLVTALLGYKLEKSVLESLANIQQNFHKKIDPLVSDLETGRIASFEYYAGLEQNTKDLIIESKKVLEPEQFVRIFHGINLEKPLTGILDPSTIPDNRIIH